MTTGQRTNPTVWQHTGLIGRLAQLLSHHHADQLLPPLLTVTQPHLTDDDDVPPNRAPLFVDVALVRQLSRLLGMQRSPELLLEVLTEIGPHLRQPTQPYSSPAGAAMVLSERELQVLSCVARGLPNEAIGRELFISADTVKTHCTRLYRKLDAVDRAHAVAIGYQRGILTLPTLAGAA